MTLRKAVAAMAVPAVSLHLQFESSWITTPKTSTDKVDYQTLKGLA